MPAGDIVDGRFEVLHTAGRGGMGVVYCAIDRETGERVAVKIVEQEDSRVVGRFAREGRVLAELNHANIVRYIAHGTHVAREQYLAMEWLEGRDLSARLKHTPLTSVQAIQVVTQVALALEVAHRLGIVHRDIKPSNIFLVNDDPANVKVLDFGVALFRETGALLTQTGVTLGTPAYMAPEQARGDRNVDSRADVFALGCVLFKCLTGRDAFEGEHPFHVLLKVALEEVPRVREVVPEIPQVVDDIVARMLSRDPSGRPRGGAEVAALLATIEGAFVETHPPPIVPRPALTETERWVSSAIVIAPRKVREHDDTITAQTSASQVSLALRQTVKQYQGQLDVVADGLTLVTFAGRGTPTDQAVRAATCALTIQTLVPESAILVTAISRESESKNISDFVPTRMERSSSEDAARVRIDSTMTSLLGGRFEIASDKSGAYLTGRSDAVESERKLLGVEIPCVGRERDLAVLTATLDECIEEPVARAMMVIAPAGVGKSRLAREFVKKIRAREDSVQVWVARADPMSAGSPFGMLAQAIRRGLDIQEGEAAVVQQRKLRAHVSHRLSVIDAGRVTEFLGEMLGVPSAHAADVQLHAARHNHVLMGDQIRRACEELFAAEASAGPLVLLMEDFQWGDMPTTKFIDTLLRKHSAKPIFVLVLARPEVHEVFPKLWSERGIQEVRLNELTRKASETLMRKALGDKATPTLIDKLYAQSEGNAFYLEELIRAAVVDGSDGLPATVLAMTQARLEALAPEARRVLRAASVFGEAFWRSGTKALLRGWDRVAQTDDWLQALERSEVIERQSSSKFPGDDEFVFRHALIREACYSLLTDADRASAHELAGDWLESVGEREAILLSEHFERGKSLSRAVGWYQIAAEQALRGNDFAATIARSAKGIACGADGETLGTLRALQAEAHKWRGENPDAARCAEEAVNRVRAGSSLWCHTVGEFAVVLAQLADKPRLMELAGRVRAVEASRAAAAAQLATAIVRVAYGLSLYGEPQLVDELIRTAEQIQLGLPTEDVVLKVRLFRTKSFVGMIRGDYAAYLELLEQSAEAVEQTGDRRDACTFESSLGLAYSLLGDYQQSEDALQQALVLAESLGLDNIAAITLTNLGVVRAERGDMDDAIRLQERAIQMAIVQSNVRLQISGQHELVKIYLRQGEAQRAEDLARLTLTSSSAVPGADSAVHTTIALAQLQLEKKSEAMDSAREAIARAAAHGYMEGEEFRTRLGIADVLSANGLHDEAIAVIAEARTRLLELASRISTPDRRRSFLEGVPAHARILTLANEMLTS